MRANKGYIPVDTMFPHNGLNTLVPGTMLAPSYSPDCTDVSVTDGALVKRKGYSKLGGLTNVGAANPIMALINFQASDGTTYLVAVSTTGFYKYVPGTPTWTNITGSTTLTGDETNRISWAIVQGTDVSSKKVLIVTNNKDKPQKWDGTSTFADWALNYPDFVTCATIAQINGHVVIGNITTSTPEVLKQNIAWSAAGKVEEFLASEEGAGEETLFDTVGPIEALVPISGYLTIYSEDSIHLMSYLGGTIIFAFEKILDDIRLVSPQAIVNLGSFHVFLSQDNFNIFDGSRTMLTIGDMIHKTYRSELDSQYKYRAFQFLDRARRKVFFGVPTGAANTKIYQVDYNLSNLSETKFTPLSYATRPLAMGFYLPTASFLWNSDNVIWSAEVGSWNDESSTQGFPNKVIGGPAGQVFLADESVYLDDTSAIAARWDSMDFTTPQEYTSELARWIEVEFEARGDAVEVLYSIDEGMSFTTLGTTTLTAAFAKYRLNIDTTGRTIRFRFQNALASSAFELRWARPWLRPAGAR